MRTELPDWLVERITANPLPRRERMEQVFARDQRDSRRVELSKWEERSLWQRFKEKVVTLFKYWI